MKNRSAVSAVRTTTKHDSVLKGARLLLVGGDPRDRQQKLIEEELELASLRWLPTRPTTRFSELRQVVACEDCDCVVIALRWARYSYSQLVRVCRERGIPFLRLPGGINPSQIAFQASQQVSRKVRRPF